MDDIKQKKPARRKASAAGHSPELEMMDSSTCGHSGCGQRCQVQYVGPTSSIHAHHALHAAQGITHVWSAAIVSGLAVVLTGVIAYSSTQPSSAEAASRRAAVATHDDITALTDRLDRMDQDMQDLRAQCAAHAATGATTQNGTSGSTAADAPASPDASNTDAASGDLVP